MEDSKSKLIKDIAQELDCGNDCYYNSKTNKIIAIPNFSNSTDEDDFQELFKADITKVEKNKADYIKIGTLESYESFKIMERFVDQVSDIQLKSELETILQMEKPFQSFKFTIETSEYRASWFAFKQNELEKIVKKRLERE